MFAGTLYGLGVAVAALGQVMQAVLDTAVNTSPILSLEQKREVIVSRRAYSAADDASQ